MSVAKICSFLNHQSRENLNVWVSERQTTKPTKSQINLNIELKRQNSQANRSVTFFKDSDTSLWRSQVNCFFCLDELNRRNQASKTYMPNCRASTCRPTCQPWQILTCMSSLLNSVEGHCSTQKRNSVFHRMQYLCTQRSSAAMM